jgi:uncharacterized protein (DUF433 family)
MLDERAAERAESRNSLAQRLLDEGLRRERHPLISFRQNADGRRRPALIGTRLYVWQIVSTVRGEKGSVEAAARYLSLTPAQIRAALAYHADFEEDVEREAAEEAEFSRREEERHRRAGALAK